MVTKNYTPGSMGFAEGFLYAGRGAGKPFMEVDEKKAKEKIKELIKQKRHIERAELGLDGDWRQNNTVIYDGKFHKYDSYEGSGWATPTLIVYFTDAPNESYECWKPEGKENDS
jgi:hypothetical protein